MMISSPFGAGETVVEVGALKRARGAKNDRIDAIRAAHHALSRDEQGAPRSGGLREAMRMVFACREGVLVSRTKAGDMAHVQGEGIPLLEFAGCAQEQVRWRIGDLPACGTLQVQVFVVAVYQVVDGRAMAKVHVLHDTEVGERLEGAVDASPMNRGVALGNRGHDLLGGEVAPVVDQNAENRSAWARHSLASSVELAADLAQKIAEGMVTASVRNGPDPTTGQTSVHLLDRSSSPLDHLCALGPLSPYRIVSSSSRISF